MWLSELVQDAIDDFFAKRRPASPPPLPTTPPHLTDEALSDVLGAIEEIRVQQSERLLEIYADVLSGLADDDRDTERYR
jgi:hypothetical protein